MDQIETIFRKAADGSLCFEDRRTEVIEVTEFRNPNRHKSGLGHEHHIFLRKDKNINTIDCTGRISVYPKGRNDSTSGLVFLRFGMSVDRPLYCQTHESINCRLEWTCLVYIVDSEGCLKYPQSLTLIYDGVESPLVEEWVQIVSADTLLAAADVLLPGDKLTLRVDMVLKQHYAAERCNHVTFGDLMRSSFMREENNFDFHKGRFNYKRLILDSPLGEILRGESRYFQRLCVTSMAEKEAGYLEIPEVENETFQDMAAILCHPHVETGSLYLNATIETILDIYRLADFYGIQSVLDTCRCWLRLIRRDHFSYVTKDDVSAISKLAETYEDPILRKVANNEDETETQSGVQHERWTCELAGSCKRTNDNFSFQLPMKIKKGEHATEDVSIISHCYI